MPEADRSSCASSPHAAGPATWTCAALQKFLGFFRVSRRAQVRHFEFSNETNKMGCGWATAAQYAGALLDWGPRLKALKPDLLLGANGPVGCHSCSDVPEDKGVCWWEQARA